MTPEEQAEMLRNLLMVRGQPTGAPPPPAAMPSQPPAQSNYAVQQDGTDPMAMAQQLADAQRERRKMDSQSELEKIKLAQKMAALAQSKEKTPPDLVTQLMEHARGMFGGQ